MSTYSVWLPILSISVLKICEAVCIVYQTIRLAIDSDYLFGCLRYIWLSAMYLAFIMPF